MEGRQGRDRVDFELLLLTCEEKGAKEVIYCLRFPKSHAIKSSYE